MVNMNGAEKRLTFLLGKHILTRSFLSLFAADALRKLSFTVLSSYLHTICLSFRHSEDAERETRNMHRTV